MKKILLPTLITVAASLGAGAVPAMRGLRPVLQADGTTIMIQRVGDEKMHFTLDSDGALLRCVDGMYRHADLMPDGTLADSPEAVSWESARIQERVAALCERAEAPSTVPSARRVASGIGLIPDRDFPCTGDQKAIVILVEYSDLAFTHPNPHEYFTDMLNRQGFSDPKYGGTGSCRDYFIESSMGQFRPQFDLFGPVKLANPQKYYGGNTATGSDQRAAQMVVEACRALDSEVDFTQYDRNGDGVIDNVFVFYAGQGEASYGGEDAIWPHSSEVGAGVYLDGKRLRTYGCTNEWGYDRPDGIGTFVHEFSHVMGLPDLYTTGATLQSWTPRQWSVLDYGPYNNQGRTPPVYSTFERNAMGWIELEELEPGTDLRELPALLTSNKGYCVTNPRNANEFYLFENRRKSGSDTYLPGEGMLVWHVDYQPGRWRNNIVNNLEAHQYVDLIEADGKTTKVARDGGDAFPGTTDMSRLDLRWWDGRSIGVSLRLITDNAADSTISFLAAEPPTAPAEGEFYTVDQALATAIDGTDIADATVRGYVVGYARSGNLSARTATFAAGQSRTNILLADSPDVNRWSDCVPVQLVNGSEARNGLNLADNPGVLGLYVEVKGTLSTVIGYRGVRSCSQFTMLDPASIGTVTIPEGDDSEAEWFTIQGVRTDRPTAPGIYIRRTAAGASKIII